MESWLKKVSELKKQQRLYMDFLLSGESSRAEIGIIFDERLQIVGEIERISRVIRKLDKIPLSEATLQNDDYTFEMPSKLNLKIE